MIENRSIWAFSDAKIKVLLVDRKTYWLMAMIKKFELISLGYILVDH